MASDQNCTPFFEADVKVEVSENGVNSQTVNFKIQAPFRNNHFPVYSPGTFDKAAGIVYKTIFLQDGSSTRITLRLTMNYASANNIPKGSTIDFSCFGGTVSSKILVNGDKEQFADISLSTNAINTAKLAGSTVQCKYTINRVARTLTISAP